MRFAAAAAICGSLVAFTPNPAFATMKVLLLGDSISIGYTPYVQQDLAGTATVSRPTDIYGNPINCQYSSYGLSQLNTWLGATKWDVIHFNFGIWDTHLMYLNGNIVSNERPVVPNSTYGYVSDDGLSRIRCSPTQYRTNLSQIVDRLQQTNAKLIFATTTPWISRRAENQFLIGAYNDVATTLMEERGVAVDDLNALITTSGSGWLSSDGVHLTPYGYQQVAHQVSASIVSPEPSSLLLLMICGATAFLGYAWRARSR